MTRHPNRHSGLPIRRPGANADPWRVGSDCETVTDDETTYIYDGEKDESWIGSDIILDLEEVR